MYCWSVLGSRLLYNPNKMHTRRWYKGRWQSFTLIYARVQYRLVGGIYTPNLCYIMTSMPLPTRNILRIFRVVGHFTSCNVQIVYSIQFVLGTLPRRSRGNLRVSAGPSCASLNLWKSPRPSVFGRIFGLRHPSVSSGDLQPH